MPAFRKNIKLQQRDRNFNSNSRSIQPLWKPRVLSEKLRQLLTFKHGKPDTLVLEFGVKMLFRPIGQPCRGRRDKTRPWHSDLSQKDQSCRISFSSFSQKRFPTNICKKEKLSIASLIHSLGVAKILSCRSPPILPWDKIPT